MITSTLSRISATLGGMNWRWDGTEAARRYTVMPVPLMQYTGHGIAQHQAARRLATTMQLIFKVRLDLAGEVLPSGRVAELSRDLSLR